MKDVIEIPHGYRCPVCNELYTRDLEFVWEEEFGKMICILCEQDLYYWLVTDDPEETDEYLVEAVERLTGKPYWEYQIKILEDEIPYFVDQLSPENREKFVRESLEVDAPQHEIDEYIQEAEFNLNEMQTLLHQAKVKKNRSTFRVIRDRKKIIATFP